MQSEPLTPASFQTLAKEVLGWEHPRVKFDTSPRAYIVAPRDDGDYNTMWIVDADALDLLAAGAWREVRERGFIVEADFRRGASECLRFDRHEYTVGSGGMVSNAADPDNVYALLLELKEKGVRHAK